MSLRWKWFGLIMFTSGNSWPCFRLFVLCSAMSGISAVCLTIEIKSHPGIQICSIWYWKWSCLPAFRTFLCPAMPGILSECWTIEHRWRSTDFLLWLLYAEDYVSFWKLLEFTIWTFVHRAFTIRLSQLFAKLLLASR